MRLQTSKANNAVVIGGGISGLATASLLAKSGWDVVVIEKNKYLGGRARVLNKKGYKFDMGPSWYLMPEVFEKFFSQFGKSVSDYYELVRLNPRYKVYFSENESITLTDNIDQNVEVFEKISPGAGKKLREFLARMEVVYKESTRQLVSDDIWDYKTWVNVDNIKSIVSITGKLRFWENWNSEIERSFKDERLRQILGFHSVFLGGSPFNTPALYSILSWADFCGGVWYPKGGMGKIIDALERLAREQGVKIITGVEAEKIVVREGEVVGVKTKEKVFYANVVVGATDLAHLELKMLEPKYRDWDSKYWESRTLGISAMLIYLGLNKKIPGATHHSISFSSDWEKNFEEIFKFKKLPSDPSIYISIRSVTDPTIVPKGCEEMFILVPLGSSDNYDQKKLEKYSSEIIDKASKLLNFDISKHITVREIYTPKDFKNDYNAYRGTALGLAHTFKQSLWFRPNNKSRKVKGLYFAGQYTNPGIGVPMALISGSMVAKMVGTTTMDKDQIFRKGSTTYYYSSIFFSGQVKKDVFTLYAYVRTMDDYVDKTKPQKQKFSEMWEQTIEAWSGKQVKNYIVTDFVELAKRKKFKWEWIQSFHTAMQSDLVKKSYKNFSELQKYMYGSAEVIGLMMSKILDLPEKAAATAALQGRAMQYLNFIRDVKEDEDLGRNYLSYTREEKADTLLWEKMVRNHIDRYRELQKQAEEGYRYIPKKYLISVKTAADMYKWTADQIYKDPSIVWRRKVKPSKVQVIARIIRNYFL